MRAAGGESLAARQQLRHLYDSLRAESGKAPGFDCFYPIDVERLIADAGWRVEVVEVPAYLGPLQTAHALTDPGSGRILIARSETGDRRRFTLAHELGHILLHPAKTLARSSPTRSARQRIAPAIDLEFEGLEAAADRFAAELLMPARGVRRAFEDLFGKIPLIPEDAAELLACGHTRARFEISKGLSLWTRAGSQRSLCSIFGVSQTTASRRILELELLA